MSQWNLLDFFWGIQLLLFHWFVEGVVYNYISSVVGILRSLEGRTFTIGIPDTPRHEPLRISVGLQRSYSLQFLLVFLPKNATA